MLWLMLLFLSLIPTRMKRVTADSVAFFPCHQVCVCLVIFLS